MLSLPVQVILEAYCTLKIDRQIVDDADTELTYEPSPAAAPLLEKERPGINSRANRGPRCRTLQESQRGIASTITRVGVRDQRRYESFSNPMSDQLSPIRRIDRGCPKVTANA